jgi:hypothetical protein
MIFLTIYAFMAMFFFCSMSFSIYAKGKNRAELERQCEKIDPFSPWQQTLLKVALLGALVWPFMLVKVIQGNRK